MTRPWTKHCESERLPMTIVKRFLFCLIPVAGYLLMPAGALAGAKEDLMISANGACPGGAVFVITNRNAASTIQATVTQSTESPDGTTVTTTNILLQPKEQKQLGCAPQGPAGNFLVTWQVQSAQYQ